jgi:hypothetical protein
LIPIALKAYLLLIYLLRTPDSHPTVPPMTPPDCGCCATPPGHDAPCHHLVAPLLPCMLSSPSLASACAAPSLAAWCLLFPSSPLLLNKSEPHLCHVDRRHHKQLGGLRTSGCSEDVTSLLELFVTWKLVNSLLQPSP